ncbi:MAG: asparagine synthase-related protein [Cyanobacteria bacterium P01_F01_bin.150]
MLSNLKSWFQPHYQRGQPSQAVRPNWWLAVGQTDSLPGDFVWQESGIAVSHASLAVSPSQRFVVIGDAYLTVDDGSHQSKQELTPADYLAVIAQAWEKQGVDCLKRLYGMFAIALWDRHQQELWLIRDPVGAYQLYYTTEGPTRWVAPRLSTLNPFRSNDLDPVVLRDYLCCAFVPGAQTFWKQVRKLRPGTCLQLPAEKTKVYWQVTEAIQGTDQPLHWHGEQLRTVLDSLVQTYLPKNKPVGVYLSGGLDSSCITALVANYHHHPVHTYSIHFGSDLPNELEFSSLVATHCQTTHHILEITPKTLWQRLPEAIALLDEPIGDPLTVPNMMMAEAARQSVQVILNGEGGDPCFGGPKNQPMLLNRLYTEATATDDPLQDVLTAYLHSFKKCAIDLPHLLQPEVWQTVESAPSVFAADLQDEDKTYLNRLMSLNIKFKGTDHILTKVNNLTRAAGIVGLSPLFDPRIVTLSMTVPPEYKLSGAEEKAVLKAAVADLLPDRIIHRPKSGMLVPVKYGFRHLWQREAKALLLSRNAAIAPYLNQTLIRQWLNYEQDIWGRFGAKLWLLSSLELWLRANL